MDEQGKWTAITGTIGDLIREAVEAERQRCLKIIVAAVAAGRTPGYCCEAIRAPATEPEPPAKPEEPMTVENVLKRLRESHCELNTAYYWCDLKMDLAALVEAQVRRDAWVIRSFSPSGRSYCSCSEAGIAEADFLADQLLSSAGLT